MNEGKNEKDVEGVATHLYLDGDEIRLNIVDENMSVLVTFSSVEEFERFKKEVNSFKVDEK